MESQASSIQRILITGGLRIKSCRKFAGLRLETETPGAARAQSLLFCSRTGLRNVWSHDRVLRISEPCRPHIAFAHASSLRRRWWRRGHARWLLLGGSWPHNTPKNATSAETRRSPKPLQHHLKTPAFLRLLAPLNPDRQQALTERSQHPPWAAEEGSPPLIASCERSPALARL